MTRKDRLKMTTMCKIEIHLFYFKSESYNVKRQLLNKITCFIEREVHAYLFVISVCLLNEMNSYMQLINTNTFFHFDNI